MVHRQQLLAHTHLCPQGTADSAGQAVTEEPGVVGWGPAVVDKGAEGGSAGDRWLPAGQAKEILLRERLCIPGSPRLCDLTQSLATEKPTGVTRHRDPGPWVLRGRADTKSQATPGAHHPGAPVEPGTGSPVQHC